MRLWALTVVCSLGIIGCQKSDEVVISGNTPPPDSTLERVVLENYVTRAYIRSLGREPDSLEFNVATDALLATGADSTTRTWFASLLCSSDDYRRNAYEQQRTELLNNIDTAEFGATVLLFQLLRQDSAYLFQWPLLDYEITRIRLLQSAYGDYLSETIDLPELQRRMCDNYFYDQINMGSANFVISTFQHLLGRNPTQFEQQSGISMVDGANAVVFLEAGSSKSDYLRILTESDSYFESQSIFSYRNYLQRDPTTLEMNQATVLFSQSQDATAVPRFLLASDEFIGLP